MQKLICLGEAMIELNQQTNENYTEGFGGDTSNCAVAAARAGAEVEVIGALGADFFGDKIFKLWQDENVKASNIYRDPHHPTGLYFVNHDKNGHHFSYYRKHSAAYYFHQDNLPVEAVKQAKILHISGISLAISTMACDSVYKAIEIAKENNVLISFDTNLRLKLWPLSRAQAIINHVASMADYLLPGLDDAQLLTSFDHPEKICTFYHNLGAKNIALTLGSKGVYISQEGQKHSIEACKVKAIDATGAGDTFDGNFLARILAGDDMVTAAEYANIAASLSVQKYGAISSMPYAKDVVAIQK